uniref:Uncharacterized protein n=1 Tax=Pristionchus pacificus TaxID=54126 RepID=A0A2A6BNP7_PRIPA|eukprot:PDM67592.1 hypothetical protein PRIPAC_49009 [Pristionchus pacificus]
MKTAMETSRGNGDPQTWRTLYDSACMRFESCRGVGEGKDLSHLPTGSRSIARLINYENE